MIKCARSIFDGLKYFIEILQKQESYWNIYVLIIIPLEI